MNMNDWSAEIIAGKTRKAIPIMTHPGIELIGKRVIDAVQNGDIHAQAIQALSEKYPSAATTVIMDLTLEAEAFGCQIAFQEEDMPHIIGRLVCDMESVSKLQVPDLNAKRIPEYLKANRLTVENTSDKPVLAGVIGPFSLAGRLFDMSEIMVACYIEPDTINLLLEKCSEFILNYCRELKRIGCSGVVVAEPAAGLLSNEDCTQFSSIYLKKIFQELQDDNFMFVLHNCGNTGHCTDAMLYTGAKGYHFGNAIDMFETLKKCPKDVLIMGNLNPVGVLKMMNPEGVYTETSKLLEATKEFNNYILSSGCDVPPHVNLENIDAFYKALENFNKNR